MSEFAFKFDDPDIDTTAAALPLYWSNVMPVPSLKASKLVPNALPLIVELARLEFGIADKPKVKVSLPELPDIVKPCPEEEAKFKLPDGELANKLVPAIDAVANALGEANAADVKYPESLFSCDILLPDTTTCFQVAMLFMLYL
jgi:hypothetical protein